MRITSVAIVDGPEGVRGKRVAALLTFEVHGLRIVGARLLIDRAGKPFIAAPKWSGHDEGGLRITDHGLRMEITAAALPLYRALGGTFEINEAALAPHSVAA